MCRDHHISCSLSLHRVTLSSCSCLESSYSRGRESAIVDLRKLNRLLDLYNECFWKFRTILRIPSVPVHLLDVRLLTPLTRIKPHLWLASPETKGHNTTDRIRHQFNKWCCLESIACAPWGQVAKQKTADLGSTSRVDTGIAKLKLGNSGEWLHSDRLARLWFFKTTPI